MDAIANNRKMSGILLAWIIICFSYILSLGILYLLFPIPESFLENIPKQGLIPGPFDIIFNSAVNGTLVLWIAVRSSYKGYKLYLQIFLPVFFVQTFQTQIETAYFIDSFRLLKGNFEVYMFFFRGAASAAIFSAITFLVTEKLIKRSTGESTFSASTDRIIKKSLWLSFLYLVLYILFGYFVAWRSANVRIFYGGPDKLNSFYSQIRSFLIDMPEMPFFQYCRGFLWIACLVPFFRGFTGTRGELIVLSALFLGLMPTVQLVYPNPIMPADVSVYHFAEVTISNGIFGTLAAWLIPVKAKQDRKTAINKYYNQEILHQ
jgi:hypothetical protein